MRMLSRAIIFFLALFAMGCGGTPTPTPPTPTPAPKIFDGDHAYAHVTEQMKLGPRPSGSAANRALADYIATKLKESKWTVVTQDFQYRGVPIRNVIGKLAEGRGPIIILGAHFDTRPLADQDRANATKPVPGANDGASGVAVLLELARVLDASKLKNEVWLAFFDAEDNGYLPTCALIAVPCDSVLWPFSVGAEYVAANLTAKPEYVVVVDMIGDADQNIYYEQNSDKELQEKLWGIAAKLGYASNFIAQDKWSMEDDHTPFLQRGIRAVDLIDFDYPYWHTIQDTADKVSGASLERVGRVIQTWLETR
ncbi:MAG: M28 family peptidase [Chloroflexi bacterium]|nr:M28 family peptidase [Chloroflexota bacterium]